MRLWKPGAEHSGHLLGVGDQEPHLSTALVRAALGLPSSCHSSAWEEGEELLFDRISFFLFCSLNSRMEADNVQFVLTRLYLVSPSYNIAASIILKNKGAG